MIEEFDDYLKRLKDRRTEDAYEYTNEDFENHIEYVKDCWKNDLSIQ